MISNKQYTRYLQIRKYNTKYIEWLTGHTRFDEKIFLKVTVNLLCFEICEGLSIKIHFYCLSLKRRLNYVRRLQRQSVVIRFYDLYLDKHIWIYYNN